MMEKMHIIKLTRKEVEDCLIQKYGGGFKLDRMSPFGAVLIAK